MDDKKIEKLLKRWGKEFKKGFFSYFILLFLKKKSMYGLEINKKLSDITNKELSYQDSSIYQILKILEKEKMVISEWQKSSSGPQRKYYSITESGNKLLFLFTKDYIEPIINTTTILVKENFPRLK